ncbi:MAG: SIMPL domain-containing protein [Rubrivivax sp.]|nr:SIMPL domain-containing protein [Rubrivivax sp.]
MRAFTRGVAIVPLLAIAPQPAPAQAQLERAPAPANLVSLSASATTELTMDRLTVVFGTTREGNEAAAVQAQLRQALDAALVEARRAARPGEVEVRTGGFSLQPRYAAQGGANVGIAGWTGRAELVVEGRDTSTIAQLMGRIRTLTVGRVGWSLSREAREKAEGEVTAQAIARFRARADEVTRHFGLTGYTVREVSVSASEPPGAVPVMAMRSAARGGSDEGLPVEAGKAQVSITVSGTVQMN